MPLWVKMDVILCISVRFVLKLLGHALLLLAGGAYLGFTFVYIFEYDDGIFDISGLEVVAILLFSALLYRHYQYCMRFKSSLWSSISRPLYAFGWLAIVVGIPVITYVYVQNELSRPLEYFETSEGKLLDWFLTLAVLYLSAPCSLKQDDKVDTQSADEPAEQEASPAQNDMPASESFINSSQETMK